MKSRDNGIYGLFREDSKLLYQLSQGLKKVMPDHEFNKVGTCIHCEIDAEEWESRECNDE